MDFPWMIYYHYTSYKHLTLRILMDIMGDEMNE